MQSIKFGRTFFAMAASGSMNSDSDSDSEKVRVSLAASIVHSSPIKFTQRSGYFIEISSKWKFI